MPNNYSEECRRRIPTESAIGVAALNPMLHASQPDSIRRPLVAS